MKRSLPSATPSSAAAHPRDDGCTDTAPSVAASSFRTRETAVAHLALAGNYLLYTAADSVVLGTQPNHVSIRRLTDGKTWRFPSSFGPTGVVDWVEAGGAVVVWTDAKFEAGDGQAPPPWRMFASDLPPTGTPRLVDSSETSDVGAEPLPRGGDAGVAWASKTGSTVTANVLVAKRRVQRIRGVPAFEVGLDNGSLIYARVHGRGQVDAFASPVGAGKSRQLTKSGQVVAPRAGDGIVVWQEPRTGQPSEIWATNLRAAQAKPHQIATGEQTGMAVPGHCFVAYFNGTGATLVDPSARWQKELATSIDIPCRIAARGNVVAWCGESPTGSTIPPEEIFVARLAPP